MGDIVNGTCHAKKAPEDGPPLFQHGNLVFQAHHVGWIVTGCFTIISMVTSFWLINKHVQWYTNKREQRYIVRILFMVPIYAVVSFASYLFWNHSTPLLLLRDCYESTVLTSFFYLLLTYLSPDPHEQKEIFWKNGLSREHNKELRRKGEKPQKWMFPINFVKSKPADGLYFLQLMKWGVLQYCVIRPITTLAAVILDYTGLYCEDSWSPGWGHIYITVVVSISVSIAMYCLLQLYVPVSHILKPQKPLLKLFAVKAVVFLTFWQATGLSLLTMFGVVKDTSFMTADNINIGLGAILETFEMMIFAFFHVKAFTYKPYRTPPDRTPRLRALAHAMNFKETFREVWAGTIYMVHRMRGRETDVQARREAALEGVFGRTRFDIQGVSKLKLDSPKEKGRNEKAESKSQSMRNLAVEVDVEETVHVGAERQWLGLGDDYAYGIAYHSRREKSDGLEEQIEKELMKRGFGQRERPGYHANGVAYDRVGTTEGDQPSPQDLGHCRSRQSWWRSIYNRISQSGVEQDQEWGEQLVPSAPPKPISRRFSRGAGIYHKSPEIEVLPHDYEDPPPPSVIRSYRDSRSRNTKAETQALSPLLLDVPQPPPLILEPLSPLRTQSYASEYQPLIPSSHPGIKRKPPPLMHDSRLNAVPPLLSPPATSSDHADSFLGRAFPNLSDASHSAEALTAGTSPVSHHSRVHLGVDRRVVANRFVVVQAPVLVRSPDVASQERLVESPLDHQPPASPYDLLNSQDASAPPKKTRSSHRRDSAQYDRRRDSRSPTKLMDNRYEGMPRDSDRRHSSELLGFRPSRRDRIVLPTPLASTAGNHVYAIAAGPPNQTFANYASPMETHSPAYPRDSPRVSPTNQTSMTFSTVPSPAASSSRQRQHSHPYSAPHPPPPLHLTRRPESTHAHTPHQLRRSSYNVKRHSYNQGKSSRRVSAPPEGAVLPELQEHSDGSLQPTFNAS